MNKKKKLILLSLIQFVLLLALLGNIMYFKQSADTFQIESRSIDPIEPLYGHYAALSYDFDEITLKDWKGNSKPKEGQTVYIVLAKGNSDHLYIFDYATDHRPKNSKYIKAQITYTWSNENDEELQINLKHNLSRYYIPEKQMDQFNEPGLYYLVTLQHKKDRTVIQSVEIAKKQ
jgi:uncharacterized membrane-anchored protein